MQQIISITSQGQITIPSSFRNKLGLKKKSKIVVTNKGDQLVIKPMSSLLEMEGILADKAIKGKSIDQIIKLEEEAVGKAVAEKYTKK